MALKVLIIPDKFKGTLTAHEAAGAIARGWHVARPEDALELLPMSDGGDGFGEIMSQLIGAAPQSVTTVDAARRPREAVWWWHAKSRTAIIESARVIGLAQLPPGKFHPFELDTYGLGAALRAAAQAGALCCLMGIGGSATNDGGFGLARALGWSFADRQGDIIERWTELRTLALVRPPERRQRVEELLVAVDVQNPLLGETGCTRIYGPQKGLRPQDFEFAERALEQLASVTARELHVDVAGEPGAGAAGGLGFGLRCFADARLEPGFALFAQGADLAGRLKSVQLVVTGEGAIDASTLMGKGVGELAGLCRRQAVPCVGLAGVVPDPVRAAELFTATHALTPEFVSREEALAKPAASLERLAARVAGSWNDANSPHEGGKVMRK